MTLHAQVDAGRFPPQALHDAGQRQPVGGRLIPSDVADATSIRGAVAGADRIVLTTGLPCDGKTWRETWRATWPRVMASVLDPCAATGARLVSVDNL